MHIRKARLGDIPAVKGIADANKRELHFIVRAIFIESQRQGELWVATTRGAVVGFLRYHARRDGWHTVYEICVDRNHRGLGIGQVLLARIPRPARLKCPVDNEANGFYHHLGWRRTAQETGRRRVVNVWVSRVWS